MRVFLYLVFSVVGIQLITTIVNTRHEYQQILVVDYSIALSQKS